MTTEFRRGDLVQVDGEVPVSCVMVIGDHGGIVLLDNSQIVDPSKMTLYMRREQWDVPLLARVMNALGVDADDVSDTVEHPAGCAVVEMRLEADGLLSAQLESALLLRDIRNSMINAALLGVSEDYNTRMALLLVWDAPE